MEESALWAMRLATASDRELAASTAVLSLVSSGAATSRADVARATSWAKSTVTKRVDRLLAARLLVERGTRSSSGGRPPVELGIAPDVGILLAVDVGTSRWRAAAADFAGTVLAETEGAFASSSTAEQVLPEVARGLDGLLASIAGGRETVRAIAVGLPCPVDPDSGAVLRPPLMPGWDRFDVSGFFADRYGIAAVLDNDVNLMALGERVARPGDGDDLLYVKLGSGIGAGVVSRGSLYRGADGAAGDIGHLPVPGHEHSVCPCGQTGCLESVASGWAVARDLCAAGVDLPSTEDVVRAGVSGDAAARRALNVAVRRIGDVLAGVVSFYNPRLIVLGGEFIELQDDLVAGIRGAIYRRALPLATRSVRIELSLAGQRAGVLGGLDLCRAQAMSHGGLKQMLCATIRRGL
jgi:predicted NBD/HSP70 family sugar kinase